MKEAGSLGLMSSHQRTRPREKHQGAGAPRRDSARSASPANNDVHCPSNSIFETVKSLGAVSRGVHTR